MSSSGWLRRLARRARNGGPRHTPAGDDSDLAVDFDDGRFLTFEVQPNERVTGGASKRLRKLRETLGDRLIAGVAFSTGARSYTYEDRLRNEQIAVTVLRK